MSWEPAKGPLGVGDFIRLGGSPKTSNMWIVVGLTEDRWKLLPLKGEEGSMRFYGVLSQGKSGLDLTLWEVNRFKR